MELKDDGSLPENGSLYEVNPFNGIESLHMKPIASAELY